jgi:adenosylhomocysteine nucleosidase
VLTSRSGHSPHIATDCAPAAEPPERPSNGAVEGAGRLGVLAALAVEARALGRAAHGAGGIDRLRDGTLVAVSGVGCAAAAQGAQRLVAAGCTALASFGLAGALDPALVPGTVLIADEVLLEGSGRSLHASPAWRARVIAALAASGLGRLEHGTLLTSLGMLGAVSEKARAFETTRAAAVDMESFAVAEVASSCGLPFLAVRVVVDRACDELPRALEGVTGPSGELSAGRLLGHLLCHPSSVPPVLRLARRYRAARRSLRGIARSGALGEPFGE